LFLNETEYTEPDRLDWYNDTKTLSGKFKTERKSVTHAGRYNCAKSLHVIIHCSVVFKHIFVFMAYVMLLTDVTLWTKSCSHRYALDYIACCSFSLQLA